MTAPELAESFSVLRSLTPPFAHELVDVLERRLLLAEAMVAMHERVGRVFAGNDDWSRKVPDTPGLRLVGAFGCDPDPSCGQEAS